MTYSIVRYYADGRESELLETGLTLEGAQAWCSHEASHGPDWFDGYVKEENESCEA